MRIEEKIFILRRQKGLSQEGLANRLNVTRQAVYKWEAGICLPEVEKIKQMATLFGLTTEELINDEISLPKDNDNEKRPELPQSDEAQPVENKGNKRKKWLIPVIIGAIALIVLAVVIGVVIYNQSQGALCVHEYGPWSINDVSHKRICKKCEDVFVEDHIYEDNICAVCNRIRIEETSGLSFVKVEGKEEYKLYSLGSAAVKKPEQINIPAYYDGLPVTTIAANAFKDCNFVKKIYMPSTITHIESYAMAGAGGKAASSSYYGVGYPTVSLYYQGSLEDWFNITVDANSIRRNTALYIDNLQVRDLVIPEMITEVPKYIFNNFCFNTVTIGDHVTKICQGAFSFANIELKLNLGTGLEEICEGAFCYSDGVDQLFLPEGLKTIGKMAFCATDLKSLNIPDSVEYIGDGAFSICSYINFVHIGKGVCYIGKGVFDGSDNNIHLFTIAVEGTFEIYNSNGEYMGNVDAELINEKPLNYMLNQNLYCTFVKEGYLK